MRRDLRKVAALLPVCPNTLPVGHNGAPMMYHGQNQPKTLPKHTAVHQERPPRVRGVVGAAQGKTTISHERDHTTRTAAGLQTLPTLAAIPQPRPIGVLKPASHYLLVPLPLSWVIVLSSRAPGRTSRHGQQRR